MTQLLKEETKELMTKRKIVQTRDAKFEQNKDDYE